MLVVSLSRLHQEAFRHPRKNAEFTEPWALGDRAGYDAHHVLRLGVFRRGVKQEGQRGV
jgi:hypothetical protein